MSPRSKPEPHKISHPPRQLEIRLLRYAAGAITALAFIGGAGWLLQRRAKRRRAADSKRSEDESSELQQD